MTERRRSPCVSDWTAISPSGASIGISNSSRPRSGRRSTSGIHSHYEKKILGALDSRTHQRSQPLIWTMFGAIREDDNPNEDPPTPQDIQPGMSVLCTTSSIPTSIGPDRFGSGHVDIDVQKNPDWAIGTATASPTRTCGDSAPQWLQCRRRTRGDVPCPDPEDQGGRRYVDIAESKDDATRQQWRQAYWATAFRALGDVLHLNQDMAQPQHTRNEPHSGKGCLFGVCLGGHTSVYERYINARALQTDHFQAESASSTPIRTTISPLSIAAYPTPTFARYADYWSTAQGSAERERQGPCRLQQPGLLHRAKQPGLDGIPVAGEQYPRLRRQDRRAHALGRLRAFQFRPILRRARRRLRQVARHAGDRRPTDLIRPVGSVPDLDIEPSPLHAQPRQLRRDGKPAPPARSCVFGRTDQLLLSRANRHQLAG